MSAGNLYRSFPSKEAIVEGLCELDQARRAESFAAFADLMADNGDLTEAMRKGLREHVFGKPPGKARLIVEIWAEAGRNPRVAEITRAIDADVLIGLERLMDVAKAAARLRRRSIRISARDSFSPLSRACSSKSRSKPISIPKPRRRWRSACSRRCSPGRCAPSRARGDLMMRRTLIIVVTAAAAALGGVWAASAVAPCALPPALTRQNRSRQSRRLPGAGAIRC